MRRRIYQDLLDWKERGMSKPLLVMGARQVGKSYIIEEFCKREFPEHLTFNLFDRADVVSLFREDINTQDKIDRLELLIGRKIDFENTVIFFDEAQMSEELISALKFFAESETKYKIICAGSLLGVKLNRFSSAFPVGKVELLHLFPMDIEEYLEACGEQALVAEIRDCFEHDRPIPLAIHERCLNQYRRYLCVGGMPEAVANLVNNANDILRFDQRIPAAIRTSYLADMGKYIISAQETSRIEATYSSIPAQLGNKSGKFQYALVRKGGRGREFASALDWLTSSAMVYRCSQVTTSQQPLRGFEKDGYFKLFLNDTGLLCSALDIRLSSVMLDEDFAYKGVIAENYVACQLASANIPLFYWASENKAEVDFLMDTLAGIVPIEVKAGRSVSSASLRVYRDKFDPRFTVRLSTRNFGFENGIKSVPLYAAFCLGSLRSFTHSGLGDR